MSAGAVAIRIPAHALPQDALDALCTRVDVASGVTMQYPESATVALGALVRIWRWALTAAPNGDLRFRSDGDVAAAAGVPGLRIADLESAGFTLEGVLAHWSDIGGAEVRRAKAASTRARKAAAALAADALDPQSAYPLIHLSASPPPLPSPLASLPSGGRMLVPRILADERISATEPGTCPSSEHDLGGAQEQAGLSSGAPGAEEQGGSHVSGAVYGIGGGGSIVAPPSPLRANSWLSTYFALFAKHHGFQPKPSGRDIGMASQVMKRLAPAASASPEQQQAAYAEQVAVVREYIEGGDRWYEERTHPLPLLGSALDRLRARIRAKAGGATPASSAEGTYRIRGTTKQSGRVFEDAPVAAYASEQELELP